MKLFIEPNDILMFRDGRPFAGGDEHFARCLISPSPATFYGALRSHILSNRSGEFDTFRTDYSGIPKEITHEIGTPETPGSLVLSQFSFGKGSENVVEPFFPVPNDVVKAKGKDDVVRIASPENLPHEMLMTDMPSELKNVWIRSDEVMENVPGYLSAQEMQRYLEGDVPVVTETKAIFDLEERTGIGKSRTSRTVETGRLYTVEYMRLKSGCGFAVEVKNTQLLPETGMLRLGGDHRSARYSMIEWTDIGNKEICRKVAGRKRFKLVLTTPAIFDNGWIPGDIDVNTLQGEINGTKVKLCGACIGRPVGIGGYDIAKNIPKLMYKAVPAGSVYYFEVIEGDIDSLFDRLWNKSISDKRDMEGFGISLIGGY